MSFVQMVLIVKVILFPQASKSEYICRVAAVTQLMLTVDDLLANRQLKSMLNLLVLHRILHSSC